jgi:hypothetical protein
MIDVRTSMCLQVKSLTDSTPLEDQHIHGVEIVNKQVTAAHSGCGRKTLSSIISRRKKVRRQTGDP